MSLRPILTLVCGQEPVDVHAQHGGYLRWFAEAMGPSVELSPWKVQEDTTRHVQLGDFAGVLITGSPASLTTPEPWMEVAIETIRQAAESQVPVLGVCFGHQLVGCAFGAPTVKAPDGGEHGFLPVGLSELGKSDPLFRDCPPVFLAPFSHSDQVDPEAVAYGNGLQVLATTANTPVQALSAGPYVRSVQFHPEFSAAIMTGYLQRDGLNMAPTSECQHATRVLRNWIEHFCH